MFKEMIEEINFAHKKYRIKNANRTRVKNCGDDDGDDA